MEKTLLTIARFSLVTVIDSRSLIRAVTLQPRWRHDCRISVSCVFIVTVLMVLAGALLLLVCANMGKLLLAR